MPTPVFWFCTHTMFFVLSMDPVCQWGALSNEPRMAQFMDTPPAYTMNSRPPTLPTTSDTVSAPMCPPTTLTASLTTKAAVAHSMITAVTAATTPTGEGSAEGRATLRASNMSCSASGKVSVVFSSSWMEFLLLSFVHLLVALFALRLPTCFRLCCLPPIIILHTSYMTPNVSLRLELCCYFACVPPIFKCPKKETVHLTTESRKATKIFL
ncbi:hypothetical protein B0H15DRAFT_13710 [Mycena belliarum]|uniref:Uncharacterized protein n=1 Tax=Mycena belliarum TaxID=1033014 RepID=A0AAD6UN64_9AGAR|nr:hypothetical protein B0H15DRAFT_13710 [Mycena belliae]